MSFGELFMKPSCSAFSGAPIRMKIELMPQVGGVYTG